jgi:hypothetical protein
MRFNHKILLRLSLHLALTSIASTTTWYVNGVSGSDSQLCKSPTAAFRTIGHALSIASSGDAIMVAAATYTENLTIFRLVRDRLVYLGVRSGDRVEIYLRKSIDSVAEILRTAVTTTP